MPAWLQASQHFNDMEQLFKSAMPAEEAAEEIYAGLVKGQVGGLAEWACLSCAALWPVLPAGSLYDAQQQQQQQQQQQLACS